MQPENWGNLVMWEREIEEHSKAWYSINWYANPGKMATLTSTKSEVRVTYNLEEEHSIWYSISWHADPLKIATLTSTKSEVNRGKLVMNNLKRNNLNFGIPSTDMLTLENGNFDFTELRVKWTVQSLWCEKERLRSTHQNHYLPC